MRQVNEPLTAKVAGPFDVERRVPGLVVRPQSSEDDTIWTFRLRDGVFFQDETPFNSAVVQANATRWLTTAAGRALLPGLLSVDAPSPGEVRFALAAPDPDFPEHLSAPQLGIVSPTALEPSSGDGAIVTRPSQTGTGAFELRERDGDRAFLLAIRPGGAPRPRSSWGRRWIRSSYRSRPIQASAWRCWTPVRRSSPTSSIPSRRIRPGRTRS